MILIAYWIITKSFDGIRLVSDVILCYIWCKCYCTNWYIMLFAQMLCALLMAQMLLCIVYGTDVIMPISCNILLARMLLCIIYGQDVIEPIFFILLSHYFIFSSGMLNNILSQMCGRLYFPIFLLSVGLFTLICIDSLIVLAKLLSSLPIILKFSMDVSWPLIF